MRMSRRLGINSIKRGLGPKIALSDIRYNAAAKSNGSVLIIAGGTISSGSTATAEGFDRSLKAKPVDPLSAANNSVKVALAGDKIVFATGASLASSAYDAQGTKLASPNVGVARIDTCAAEAGNIAVFSGGRNSATQNYVNGGDAFSAELTKVTIGNIGSQRTNAGSVGDYAIIPDLRNDSTSVWAVNSAATITSAASFSQTRNNSGVVNAGNKVVFAGGVLLSGPSYRTSAEAYDSALVKTTVASLTTSHESPLFASNSGHGIISGGGSSSTVTTNTSEAYTSALTKVAAPSLSKAKKLGSGASISDVCVLMGGRNANITPVTSYSDIEVIDSALSKLW